MIFDLPAIIKKTYNSIIRTQLSMSFEKIRRWYFS
jgi:hypothetical protein